MATIRKKLENTLVPVRVILGRTIISVKDLIELAPGDVVPLHTGINDELEVLVGQSPKFLGRPGMHGNRTAVQITGLVKEEEEDE